MKDGRGSAASPAPPCSTAGEWPRAAAGPVFLPGARCREDPRPAPFRCSAGAEPAPSLLSLRPERDELAPWRPVWLPQPARRCWLRGASVLRLLGSERPCPSIAAPSTAPLAARPTESAAGCGPCALSTATSLVCRLSTGLFETSGSLSNRYSRLPSRRDSGWTVSAA